MYLAKSAEEGFPQKIFLSNPTVPAFSAALSVSLIFGIIPTRTTVWIQRWWSKMMAKTVEMNHSLWTWVVTVVYMRTFGEFVQRPSDKCSSTRRCHFLKIPMNRNHSFDKLWEYDYCLWKLVNCPVLKTLCRTFLWSKYVISWFLWSGSFLSFQLLFNLLLKWPETNKHH